MLRTTHSRFSPSHSSSFGRRVVCVSSLFLFIVISFACVATSFAQSDNQSPVPSESVTAQATLTVLAPVAPLGVAATDFPNDGGGAMEVRWTLSPSDKSSPDYTAGTAGELSGYAVFRAESAEGPFELAGEAIPGIGSITDNNATTGVDLFYRVDAFFTNIDASGQSNRVVGAGAVIGPARSSGQWFNTTRGYCLIFFLIVSGAILFYIRQAQSGRELFIRKIAALDSVDEAVGRATEMGKKVIFIPGIQDMNDIQTIAGVAILGRVASLAAQYDAKLEAPMTKSLVMITVRETMKEAYAKAGRPQNYNDSQVPFISDEQFAYAAALDGMFLRERPATIFYMGAFFAESLILSETGNSVGAIQVAGTAEPSQLPFFVAACDYTLIGEELFAASAYLSREPRQLGSLRGQDFGKLIFLVAIVIGVILATYATLTGSEIFDFSSLLRVG